MSNKELDDPFIKELLELASRPVKENGKEMNDVEHFIQAKQIRNGNCRVYVRLIWDTYRRWSKQPMSEMQFYTEFKKHFTQCRIGKARFYCLHPSSFDISKKKYLELRQEAEQIRLERKRKKSDGSRKKEEEPRPISGPKPPRST